MDDLTEQQKKATLYGALSIVGAFLCFAAAAFFPGALLGAGEPLSAVLGWVARARTVDEFCAFLFQGH